MKFIKLFLLVVFFIFSCSPKRTAIDPNQMYSPYKFLNLYSRKIEPKTGLKLSAYAYNAGLPKGYQIEKGIGNFCLSYFITNNNNDLVSITECRNLLIFTVENFLEELNRNEELKSDLDIYPFTSSRIDLSIYFEDENRIDLGQGVARVYLFRGKIVYEGYDIIEYRSKFPALGKHYIIHEESYEEALDIVKREGNLTYLD